MKELHSTTHHFAFYSESIRIVREEGPRDIFAITDLELVYRIVSVLRLERDDKIILFDRSHHLLGTIVNVEGKKSVTIQIHELVPNKQLNPPIHWLLPLLKREAFEEALYSLTELGAQTIQPLLTKKTVRYFAGERELSRCQKILIAAAEQSKQFVIPILQPIIPIDVWLLKVQHPGTLKIFFDPQGLPLSEVIDRIKHEKPDEILALAGPEGDLNYEEKLMLNDQGFIFCALTQTVLRAQQAVAVGLGSLRSLL